MAERKSTSQLGDRVYPCSCVGKVAFVLGHLQLQKTHVFSESQQNACQPSLLRPVVLISGTTWMTLAVAQEQQHDKEEYNIVES